MISVIQLDLILSRSRNSFIFQELIYKTTYENILNILKPKKITILATNEGAGGGRHSGKFFFKTRKMINLIGNFKNTNFLKF